MDKEEGIGGKEKTQGSDTANAHGIAPEWYKALIQRSSEGFLLIEYPSGNILDANDALCNMLGYSYEELLSINIKDIEVSSSKSSESIKKRSCCLEESETAPFETRHRCKDGSIMDVSVSLRHLEEGLSFCFYRDIKDQKKKQEKERLNLKHVKKTLKETEDRYRTIIELGTKLGDAVIILQDVNGREGMHTYVSDQWPDITGYPKEELLAMSFFDLVSQNDKEGAVHRYRQKMSGKAIPDLSGLHIIHKDGSEVLIEITSAATSYQGKPANAVYINNIEKTKQSEKRLTDENEAYMALFENSAVPLLELDYSETKLLFDDLKHKGVNDLRAYLENDIRLYFEMESKIKWVKMNHGFAKLHGSNSILNIRNVFTKQSDNKDKIEQYCFQHAGIEQMSLLFEGSFGYVNQISFKNFEGEDKHIISSIFVPKTHRNTLAKVINVVYDVTELQEAKNQLRTYQEHFKQVFENRTDDIDNRTKLLRHELQKSKALEKRLNRQIEKRLDYNRILLHELKTPLTIIEGACEILKAELKGDLFMLAQNIDKGTQELNRRVNELFDIAKIEIGNFNINCKPIDPIKLMRDITTEMKIHADKKNQSLIIQTSDSLPSIWADEDRMRQVFYNIINNALKFNRTRGKVFISAKKKIKYIVFSICDEGDGLNDYEKRNIFKPYKVFSKGGANLNGIGLGLYIAKVIINLHQGQIWVQSQPTKGCIFNFSIPITKKATWGNDEL